MKFTWNWNQFVLNVFNRIIQKNIATWYFVMESIWKGYFWKDLVLEMSSIFPMEFFQS